MTPLLTIVGLLACTVVPILLLSLLLHQDVIAVALGDLSVRLRAWLRRRFRGEEPAPLGRPIEQIATDLRRLSTRIDRAAPGMSFAKYDSTRRAYDDALVEGCRAMDVPERLSWLPPGVQRDQERRNLEFRLEQCGLRVHDAA